MFLSRVAEPEIKVALSTLVAEIEMGLASLSIWVET